MADGTPRYPASEHQIYQTLLEFKRRELQQLKVNLAVVNSKDPDVIRDIRRLYTLRDQYGLPYASTQDLTLHLSFLEQTNGVRRNREFLAGLSGNFSQQEKPYRSQLYRTVDSMVGEVRQLTRKLRQPLT